MRSSTFLAIAPLALLGACGSEPDAANDDGGNAAATNEMASAPVTIASAALAAGDGSPRGMARITGTTVNLQALGLAPGRYGVHIHMTGRCDAPSFESAGGHFNPAGKQHGFDNPAGPHAGDLPNLVIGSDGSGVLDFALQDLVANGEDGLFDADGAAIVIHAGPDDLHTDPSGNSGERIACGVLMPSEPPTPNG